MKSNLLPAFLLKLMVSGKTFCLLLVMALAACTSEPPNVILVLTDDQGYGDLECHNNPYLKTPALDKFYDAAVRFTDFHVDPCCSPTRSSLMTGCYSIQAGVWHTIGGRSLLKEGMTTIADLFSNNGYETAIFGKWHLGENYPFRPMDRGFKEAIVHRGGGSTGNSNPLGNDYFDDIYVHNGEYEYYEGYCNTVWFNEAIRYIKQNQDKPFFCFISTNLPHAPLLVEGKYAEPYRKNLSDRLSNYYGMVSKIDEDFAALDKELHEMGLADNTIMIFMTDNGPCPWFGGIVMDFDTGYPIEGYSAGMRGGKIWGYENAHRVPFFIRWPNGDIGGGKDIETLSAHIDIMPTLIDLCKLETPAELEFDGISLAPLLQKRTAELPERTYITHNQRVQFPVKDKEYQVMTERWRLVKREKDELYDITIDPGQRNDLASEYPEVVKELYKKYDEWWDNNAPPKDWFAEIHIGSSEENPLTLFAHDSYSRNGQRIWVVKAERDGKYAISINRWPAESGKKIVENRSGDKIVPIISAELKVGNIELNKPVTPDMTSAKFIVNLKKGTTCINTSLLMENGNSARTECVYIDYLGEADSGSLLEYQPSDPDEILRRSYDQKVILFD